jgi:heparan-alpha-glucosaminide N-acetyltransferase
MADIPNGRAVSIDIFRAVTMLLMIFVNDLWSLNDIPKWLEHASADEDYMGLADIVFPCFLVIVGMSIPFAVEKRVAAGDSNLKIISHILIRTFSLLVMGVFIVNIDNFSESGTGFSRHWYQLIMVTGFFLIWNMYPAGTGWRRFLYIALQTLGVLLMLFLAFRYRGDDGSGGTTVMATQWWGILGLIGWAYGSCAILYVFLRKHLPLLVCACLFFLILNIVSQAGWLAIYLPEFWGSSLILGDGAFHAFTMSGIMAIMLIRKAGLGKKRMLVMSVAGAAMIVTGLFLNNFFIFSKIKATPPWVFTCTGIAFVLYVLIFFIAEVKGRHHWFDGIKIAGTYTLTCYLVPYFVYPLAVFSGITLPDYVLSGIPGIFKSLIFSFLIIYVTAMLTRAKIRLKL